MDLKEFYFQNIKESEYHYRFLESVKKVNYTYNRNLLGGLYRENPVKSRNYEAVKSSKKWRPFQVLCKR